MTEPLQAVILAGGLGTRLRELYPDRPKGLVPILGKPFLEWQIEWLRRGGVEHVHVAAGHMAEKIAEWAKRFPQVSVSTEPRPLGTAGGLKFVESHLESDPFLVLNGDSLMPELSFQSLEKRHANSSNVWTTIVVARIEEAGRYGTVEFDDAGGVTAFREKAERKAGWINGGVYLMSRRTLGLIEIGKSVSIETDLFPQMTARGELRAFKATGPMLDMGTPDGIRVMEAYLSVR